MLQVSNLKFADLSSYLDIFLRIFFLMLYSMKHFRNIFGGRRKAVCACIQLNHRRSCGIFFK